MTKKNSSMPRRSSGSIGSLPLVASDKCLKDLDDQEGKANQLESTVNLVNGILGAGLLGMPFAFKSCGLVLGLVLLFLCLSMSRVSLLCLVQLGHSTGLRSYEELAQLAYGKIGLTAVNVSVVLLNIGNIIAYMNIFVDTVLWFGRGWLFEDFEQAKNTLLTLTVFLGMLPVGLTVTSGKHMASLAFFAVTVYSCFCIYMTFRGLQSFFQQSTTLFEGLTLWQPRGLIVAFPIMLYSFTAHNVIFPIYTNMKANSLGNIKSVTESALSIVLTIYIVVGSSAYVMFRHHVQGDVLTNLGQNKATASTDDLLKFFYGLTSMATVPILLVPIKACVFSMPYVKNFNKNTVLTMNKRGKLHTAIAVCSLGTALICATLIPNIEYVFRLTGGTTCVTLGCILPSLIYLKLYSSLRVGQKQKISQNILFLLAIFGILSGFICTYSAVLDVDKADSEIRHHHHHHHSEQYAQGHVKTNALDLDRSSTQQWRGEEHRLEPAPSEHDNDNGDDEEQRQQEQGEGDRDVVEGYDGDEALQKMEGEDAPTIDGEPTVIIGGGGEEKLADAAIL